jgi:phage terminase Nu1 subunit (DNA packaging protein)
VRTVDKLIARGLPVVGRGRLLRVDVAAADEWLRLHLGDEPEDEGDDVERLARANAGARR